MSDIQINRTALDLLYLSACALHGAAPEEEQISEMNLTALLKMAKRHSMAAIACMALESGDGFLSADSALTKEWQDEKNKVIRKNLLLDAECREILDYMEAAGIWHMPLKGAVLQGFYPKYGMRQMADYDILYDPVFQEQLRKYMTERGYASDGFENGNHDAYYKLPIYNFELHRALFDEIYNPVWCDYYCDVKDRLIPDENAGCGYQFSDNDFYIYMTAHAYKHYDGGGTGLRSLMDCYVYCREKKDVLDWDYIRPELDALGITEFEQMCRELAVCLFSEPSPCDVNALTAEQKEAMAYFTGSGTYGILEHKVENKLRVLQQDSRPVTLKTRWRYLWGRLVPDMEWLRRFAPFCYRHKWTIPFFLVYRALKGLFLNSKVLLKELRIVRKIDK